MPGHGNARIAGALTRPAVWGATPAEVAATVPADTLVDRPRARWVRAASSTGSPAMLWRWVTQLTVAPYSYDVLDNLGRRSPRTLTPGAERVVVGQRLLVLFVVDSVVPGEHLTLRRCRVRRPDGLVGEFAITYTVHPAEYGSRLVATVVVGGSASSWAAAVRHLLAWGDLVMMRRQLRTLAGRGCVSGSGHGTARTRPYAKLAR